MMQVSEGLVQSMTGGTRGPFIVLNDWNFPPISKAHWHFITIFSQQKEDKVQSSKIVVRDFHLYS